jgi:hypothetical protein
LNQYFDSLEKIKHFEVEKAFCGYCNNMGSIKERADIIISPHIDRLEEIKSILAYRGPVSVMK